MRPERRLGAEHAGGKKATTQPGARQTQPRPGAAQGCAPLSTRGVTGIRGNTMEHLLVASHGTRVPRQMAGKRGRLGARTSLPSRVGHSLERALRVTEKAPVAAVSVLFAHGKLTPSKCFDSWSPESRICVLVTSVSSVSRMRPLLRVCIGPVTSSSRHRRGGQWVRSGRCSLGASTARSAVPPSSGPFQCVVGVVLIAGKDT